MRDWTKIHAHMDEQIEMLEAEGPLYGEELDGTRRCLAHMYRKFKMHGILLYHEYKPMFHAFDINIIWRGYDGIKHRLDIRLPIEDMSERWYDCVEYVDRRFWAEERFLATKILGDNKSWKEEQVATEAAILRSRQSYAASKEPTDSPKV